MVRLQLASEVCPLSSATVHLMVTGPVGAPAALKVAVLPFMATVPVEEVQA